jgi:hypothetical protein
MPNPQTTRKAKAEIRQGYSPKTAAGEFVHEEIHHQRQRKHGAETRRQAIAIGLSKARQAGLPIGRRPKSRRRPGTGASEVSRRAGRARKRTTSRHGARTSAARPGRASAKRSRSAARRPSAGARGGSRGRRAGRNRTQRTVAMRR